MKKNLINAITLSLVCIFAVGILWLTNIVTSPIIKNNESLADNEKLLTVLPDGKDFSKVELSDYILPSSIISVYSESGGGYVIELETSGYSSGLRLMCGVDASGKIVNAICTESAETLGYEKSYGERFVGSSLDTVNGIDTISGATKTTQAYKSAVKDALSGCAVLNGENVDIRTEEEILRDNLNEALPDGNGDFEEILITEQLNNISAVYRAVNGMGFVYVIRDVFVGVDAKGQVVTDTDESIKNDVSSYHKILSESRPQKLDISELGLSSSILEVYKTESGNYVFYLRGAGFGINGNEWYNPSGDYIYISLAVSRDGKIISVLTTDESETDGIGSVCGDKKFYGQFVGKTEDDYKDIDGISGATLTTNGYKSAVGRALEAVRILEGVG